MSKGDDGRAVVFDLRVAVIRVGGGYIASGTLAGIKFRGNRSIDREQAVGSLFMQMTQGNNPDAVLALSLAATGDTLAGIEDEATAAFAALEASPSPRQPAATPASTEGA